MKALFKKVFIVLFSVGLVFGLAACNSESSEGNEEPSNTENNNENNNENKNENKNESEPKEKVEITFWHVFSEKDAGPLNERIEAFNSSQDEIVVEAVANADATKQLTAISGGNPPDIALTYWNNVGPWGDAGAIQPLDDYFAQDSYDTSMFIPAALERMQVNGETYALPFTMSMASTIMYNKKTFEEAGLTAPPETMEELMEYAKQLTKRDGDNITQIGFIPDFPWIDNVFWPVVFGGSFYDEASGKVTPNNPQNVKSIEYQRAFYEEFGNDNIEKFRSGMGQRGTDQDPLLTGQLAMMVGWEYNFKDERAEDGPIGVAPFPYPADNPELAGAGMVSPRAVFIPAKAENKEAAWKFMQYLLGKESQIEFSIDAGVIPTVIEALDDPALIENPDVATMLPFYEAAKSENLQGFPNSVYINQYLQFLTEETEKALKGSISAQEAMDNVAEKVQPLADEAK